MIFNSMHKNSCKLFAAILRTLNYLDKNSRTLVLIQIVLTPHLRRLLLFHPIWLQADLCHRYLKQELQREGFQQGFRWAWVEAKIVISDTFSSWTLINGQQILSIYLAGFRIFCKLSLTIFSLLVNWIHIKVMSLI